MADEDKGVEELETEEKEEKREVPEHLKDLEEEIRGTIKDNEEEEEEEKGDGKEEKTPPDDTEEKDDKGKPGEAEKDEKDSIPNALKERAVKVDMTLDELDTYSDIAMLEKYVALKEEVLAGKSEEGGASKEDEGKKFDEALKEVFDFEENEEDANGEKWDPELVGRFGKMKELFVEMKKSSDDQGKLIKELQSSGYSGEDFLNSKITELGKPYQDLFGKDGSISDEQQKARDNISDHIDTFTEAAEKSGEKISKEEAFKRALNGLHGDKVVKQEGKKVAKLAADRAKRAIEAPRGKGGTFLKDKEEPAEPADKAINALEERWG